MCSASQPHMHLARKYFDGPTREPRRRNCVPSTRAHQPQHRRDCKETKPVLQGPDGPFAGPGLDRGRHRAPRLCAAHRPAHPHAITTRAPGQKAQPLTPAERDLRNKHAERSRDSNTRGYLKADRPAPFPPLRIGPSHRPATPSPPLSPTTGTQLRLIRWPTRSPPGRPWPGGHGHPSDDG